MKSLKRILLNDRIIMAVILFNSVIIFLQESGYNPLYIRICDVVCTLIFMLEMAVKQKETGIRAYWKDGWNKLDGTLVILSVPSVIGYLIPNDMSGLSVLLILRMLRIFRFFRVFHLFPDFTVIMRNVRLAMRQSFSVFVGFLVLLVVAGMINCYLFGKTAPEYFGTPLDSIYSIFRLCTIEGWYDIPDAVTVGMSHGWVHAVRFYFCMILFAGGIIGLSIVNSIFVDAMVSDNNDEVLARLDKMQKTLDELSK